MFTIPAVTYIYGNDIVDIPEASGQCPSVNKLFVYFLKFFSYKNVLNYTMEVY